MGSGRFAAASGYTINVALATTFRQRIRLTKSCSLLGALTLAQQS